MDPVTAIGVLGSVLGVAGIVAQCLKGLTSLTTAYRSADLLLMLVIGHLHTVEAILGEICTWLKGLPEAWMNVDLLGKIDRAVKCCAVIAEVLAEKIDGLPHGIDRKLTLKAKLLYMLGEREIKEMNTHLATQVQALHILVDAGRCNTFKKRKQLLDNVETRFLLRQIEDDSSSYLHKPSAAPSILTCRSGITDHSYLLDNEYEFDSVVLTSRVYRNAFIKMLRQERTHLSNHTEQRRASRDSGDTIQPIAREASAQEDTSELDDSQQQIITRTNVILNNRSQVEVIGEISNNNRDRTNMKGGILDTSSRRDRSIVFIQPANPVSSPQREFIGSDEEDRRTQAAKKRISSKKRRSIFPYLTSPFGKQWNETSTDRATRKVKELIDADSKEEVQQRRGFDTIPPARHKPLVLGIEPPEIPPPSLIPKFSGWNKNSQAAYRGLRYKVAIVGSAGCGKTALVKEVYDPTICDTYAFKVTNNPNGQEIPELDISDSTGLNEYRSLRKIEHRNSQSVCICFSVTSRSSLEEVLIEWIHEVADYAPEITIILVGCQKDRVVEREVSTGEGWGVSRQIGAVTYIECSARTGEGVENVSNRLAEEAIKRAHANT